jgi:beta-glucosidase-like glycosyl hydrolase
LLQEPNIQGRLHINNIEMGRAPYGLIHRTLMQRGRHLRMPRQLLCWISMMGHRLAMGHPGAAVIPTALALAAETQATAYELYAAIVAGYEVSVRLGKH